jgi:aminoglycoside phosphotransferase family enzyme/predicted kinase
VAQTPLPTHVEGLRRRLATESGSVQIIQTHISYVLLTTDEVWKLKKPVDLGFLDYSTLDSRRTMCEEEVRLNGRLAPGVYLGVEPVDSAGRDQGEPVDFAVRMRRLPDSNMLDKRLAEDAVERQDALNIGKLLASFHVRSQVDSARGKARLDAHLRQWDDNFHWLDQFPGLLDARLVEQCRRFRDHFVGVNGRLLEERHVQQAVDGHGDLRAEHICLLDPPVVFDCIEFSEELRQIDAANDLAFLLMDLEFLGQRAFSDAVAESYIYWTRDASLGAVLDFYRCYRAVVRAKVEAIKAAEGEVEDRERRRAAYRAVRYLFLARHYATPVRLVIVRGYAGTGKSTVAARIAATGAVLLSSDVIRGDLVSGESGPDTSSGYRKGAYSPDITEQVYRLLVEEAANHLVEGRSVVLDGTFLPQASIDAVAWLRDRWPGPAVSLLVDPGEERVRANLLRRSQEHDVSEADLQVYLRQKAEEAMSPLPGISEMHLDQTGCDMDSRGLLQLIEASERWSPLEGNDGRAHEPDPITMRRQ